MGVATTGPLSYWGRVPKRRTSALTSPASSESWRESPGADSSAAVNAQLTASGRLCETRTCSTGRHARSHCGKRILVYSHGPSVVGVGPSCARRKGVMRELGPVYSSSVEGCAASDHAENEWAIYLRFLGDHPPDMVASHEAWPREVYTKARVMRRPSVRCTRRPRPRATAAPRCTRRPESCVAPP